VRGVVLRRGLGEGLSSTGRMMSSPSNTTKWMSYLAEGLLTEEEVQPSNPFFWHPAEQVDCRYACTASLKSPSRKFKDSANKQLTVLAATPVGRIHYTHPSNYLGIRALFPPVLSENVKVLYGRIDSMHRHHV